MHLRLLAETVLDVAADTHSFAYAQRDTDTANAGFVSFFLCDWATLECREVPPAVFLQLKFGASAAAAQEWFENPLRCKAALLPDGGCAVLESGARLHLFRPDGVCGASVSLHYKEAPAQDIAAVGDSLWCTVPTHGALVRYSLAEREITLRVGGRDVFAAPQGLTRSADTLWLCCAGDSTVQAFSLTELDITERLQLPVVPVKYYRVFSRAFVLLENGSLCTL
ncbi:MAG: hypothetical protein LBC83_01610 [Oscillospiraceae bacterium]|jgi:hypothetical protein|nr:hypothetical protein [Oscillospiraceae bacterium]